MSPTRSSGGPEAKVIGILVKGNATGGSTPRPRMMMVWPIAFWYCSMQTHRIRIGVSWSEGAEDIVARMRGRSLCGQNRSIGPGVDRAFVVFGIKA